MSTPTILIWGLRGDSPLDGVLAALLELGANVFFLDQRRILESCVSLSVDGVLAGELQVGHQGVELASVAGVYLRPHDTRKVPALRDAAPGQSAWQHALAFDDALLAWLEICDGEVVNRPSAMAPNNAKPLQLRVIRDAGFSIPQTLVTNDRTAALEFRARYGCVVYKSISGTRSIVHRFDDSRLDRLTDLAACPTQFQEYISGLDHRVHVVGERVFACSIVSEADDYRYASGDSVQIHTCHLPDDIADNCVRMVASMGLRFAGIDLRRSPAGEWFCFEVNPSPGFTYFEDATGQPIADAVAQLLCPETHKVALQ
jgi:ribosomal protein S6-L-glutamate ligase RimK-like protein